MNNLKTLTETCRNIIVSSVPADGQALWCQDICSHRNDKVGMNDKVAREFLTRPGLGSQNLDQHRHQAIVLTSADFFST